MIELITLQITSALRDFSGEWTWIVGIIILGISIPIFLHKYRIINLKNPLRRKKTYGRRFGHGMK